MQSVIPAFIYQLSLMMIVVLKMQSLNSVKEPFSLIRPLVMKFHTMHFIAF